MSGLSKLFNIPQTRHDLALWHMRELERLVHEDGGNKVSVIVIAEYEEGRGVDGYKGIHLHPDKPLIDRDGIFREVNEL